LTAARDAALAGNTDAQIIIKELKEENRTYAKEVDDLTVRGEELSKSCNDLKSSLDSTLSDKNNIEKDKENIVSFPLKASGSEPMSSVPNVVLYETEISELKELLADANKSVEEARAETIASDFELEEKERDLEEALQIASERDEAARISENKVQELEHNRLSSPEYKCTHSEEELMKDMELLLEEKMQLEFMLEDEIATRKKNGRLN